MKNRHFPFLSGLKDYGPHPFIVDIEGAAETNPNFRAAIWTGNNLQVTLMSIIKGGEIGVEMHPNVDQFIRIEDGNALVKMGDSIDNLCYQQTVDSNYAIIIPAGTWHNIINIGMKPLKLYSIYSPPEHPYGTIHKTKEIADAEEHNH